MSNHGRFVWFELFTDKIDEASEFYSSLLGWKITKKDNIAMNYNIISNNGVDIGGIMSPLTNGVSTHWYSYLSVDNIDDFVFKVEETGGKIIRPPFEIPNYGKISL